MSRIISVRPNLNAEHFDDVVSEDTQVGLQKSLEASQLVQPKVSIFIKKSDKVISSRSEAT
jgi:hypothetical protein